MPPGATLFWDLLRGRSGEAPAVLPPLVERLRRGEDEAVGAAFDLHHKRVRAFAQRLVGDAATADDLVQEVFVSLPSAVRRFRGDSSLETFLIAIAINHARHHVRAAARLRKALERLHREPIAPAQSADRGMQRRELAQALARALDGLPLDQRVAFVLCEVEERSSVQVAALLQVPEATVRTRVFHARKKLRASLTRAGHGAAYDKGTGEGEA